MAPLAPYMAEELYSGFEKTSVHVSEWPKSQAKYLVENETTIMLAINGKVRSELKIETSEIENKELVLSLAKQDEKIIKWLDGSDIVKEIYVSGKMVNLVVKL